MPKTKTLPVASKGLLILKNGTRKVLIPRPKTYNAALATAVKHFPRLSRRDLVLETTEFEYSNGEPVEIALDSWDLIIGQIRFLTVRECNGHEAEPGPDPFLDSDSDSDSDVDEREDSGGDGRIGITIKTVGGNILVKGRVKLGSRCRMFLGYAEAQLAVLIPEPRFVYNGEQLEGDKTFAEYDMQDGDAILVFHAQYGGKPVIYLFSPVELNASVILSLVPEWSFTAIYPVVPIKSSTPYGEEQIQWSVQVHTNGILTETSTGLQTTYLFWEAHVNALPSSSPTLEQLKDHFSPSTCDLSDTDSVVLPVSDVPAYLDQALQALTLHTEPRTSFITYWLPSLLKHKHVALRFLPQSAYECAARLDVVPSPDVITRVFMLFKGVIEDELPLWENAQIRANTGSEANPGGRRWAVNWWTDVVGVDVERALNDSLYRVLEWGGMEVLQRI